MRVERLHKAFGFWPETEKTPTLLSCLVLCFLACFSSLLSLRGLAIGTAYQGGRGEGREGREGGRGGERGEREGGRGEGREGRGEGREGGERGGERGKGRKKASCSKNEFMFVSCYAVKSHKPHPSSMRCVACKMHTHNYSYMYAIYILLRTCMHMYQNHRYYASQSKHTVTYSS